MSAVQIGATESAAAANGSVTVTKPTGTATGNILIAQYVLNGLSAGVGAITLPSGFVQIRAGSVATMAPWMGTYYKIATGSEPADYSFSNAGGVQGSCTITRFFGSSTLAPYASSEQYNDTASTTATGATLTPSVADSMLLFLIGTPPEGASAYAIATSNPTWAEAYDNATGFSPARMLATATRPQTTATGAATATISSGRSCVHLVALAPRPSAVISDSAGVTDATSALRTLVVRQADSLGADDDVSTDSQRPWYNQGKNPSSWANQQKTQ